MSSSRDRHVERKLTDEDMLYCVFFAGDGEPHTNSEFARTQVYEKETIYGDGTAALAFGLLLKEGYLQMTDNVASVELRYLRPVYVGDSISVHEVARNSERDDRGSTLGFTVRNQAGEEVLQAKLGITDNG